MAATCSLALAAALALLAASCGREPAPAAADPAELARAEGTLEEGRPGEARRILRALDARVLATADQRLRAARAALRARDPALGATFLGPDVAGPARPDEAARLLRAECLLRSGALREAGEALSAMEAAGAKGDRWRYLHAHLALARSEKDHAQREIEDLAREGTRDPDALLLWAEVVRDMPVEAMRRIREGLGRTTDRALLLRGLGRALLAAGREPGVAAAHLEQAVRARPWDRDARLDLARARVRTGGEKETALAVEDVRRLVADDGADADVRLALAEVLGASGLAAVARAGGNAAAGEKDFREAEALYRGLLAGEVRDRAAAVALLQGLARTHVERIPVELPEVAAAPGSHFARAMEALAGAAELDPEARFTGAWGVKSLAETHYLRGRACRLTHSGAKDNAEAVGWYEKALAVDGLHLEASWDLVMIYYDFLRRPEYIRKAAELLETYLLERERRGMPAIPPEHEKIILHVRALAAEGKGFEPGTLTPDPPKKDGEPR